MSLILGIDLGTTKITSVAVSVDSGEVVAVGTVANEANITSDADRARGRSEWDVRQIVSQGLASLQRVTEQLGPRAGEVAGIGVTGQQHGAVLVDSRGDLASPLLNWQDRRAMDAMPGSTATWLDATRSLVGDTAWQRTGCRLQPGFMAVTLFWLKSQGQLPTEACSLFLMDHFAALLTGERAISEPSCAGSSGVFNVRIRQWDDDAIASLGLPRSLFPEVREADSPLGGLRRDLAEAIGLPVGLPVFPAIGDHQASYLGSVTDRRHSVLVNVGTGAQVAVYTDGFDFAPPIELRPCPLGGNLLSNVGLAGGWSYQVLENFVRDIGRAVFEIDYPAPLYETLTRLAGAVAPGADGLRCEPLFAGTRLDPTVRGTLTGLSPQNFTARHLARAVLEGMARSLREGAAAIERITGLAPTTLVAAGNGLRENPLLAEIVSQAFGLPLTQTRHREEAACGAARVAAIGLGLSPRFDETTGIRL